MIPHPNEGNAVLELIYFKDQQIGGCYMFPSIIEQIHTIHKLSIFFREVTQSLFLGLTSLSILFFLVVRFVLGSSL